MAGLLLFLWKRIVLHTALLFIVLGVFSDIFSEQRVFDSGDDRANYVENKMLAPVPAGGWHKRLQEIWESDSIIGVWEPAALAVKLLLAQTFGLHARTFTGAAVALHGVACMLAMECALLGYGLLRRQALQHENVRRFMMAPVHAWYGALLLGVHPLRVEPLAWASGLPYEIALVFGLMSTLCHILHRKSHSSIGMPRPFGFWRLTSAAMLLLACHSKAAALGFPPALVLLDALILWESESSDSQEEAVKAWQKLFRVVAFVTIDTSPILAAAGVSARSAFSASKGPDLHCKFVFQGWQRCLRASYMAILYLIQQFFAHDLCVLHAVPLSDIILWSWRFGGAALALAVIGGLAIRNGLRSSCFFALYLALLSPTLGILSDHVVETAADRYCYITSMALGAPALAMVLARLHPQMGPITGSTFFGIAGIEASYARRYVQIWLRPEDIIRHAAQHSPRFYRTRYIHGMDLLKGGHLAQAESQMREALALCPEFTNTHFGLTQALFNQGRIPEATDSMRAGVKFQPQNTFGHFNLGMLLQRSNRHKEAVASFKKAVQLEPKDPQNHQALHYAQQAVEQASQPPAQPKQHSAPNHSQKSTKQSNPKSGEKGASKSTSKLSAHSTAKPAKQSQPAKARQTSEHRLKPGSTIKPVQVPPPATDQLPQPTNGAEQPAFQNLPPMAEAKTERESSQRPESLSAQKHNAESTLKKTPVQATTPTRTPMPTRPANLGSELEDSDVYLSIIGASRNDDYAGALEPRVMSHVAILYHQLLRHCLWDVELLLVEWNPPSSRPPLSTLVLDGLSVANTSRAATEKKMQLGTRCGSACAADFGRPTAAHGPAEARNLKPSSNG